MREKRETGRSPKFLAGHNTEWATWEAGSLLAGMTMVSVQA